MPHRPRHTSQSRHAHHAAAYSKENGDFVLQAAQSANITDPKELANFMGQMQVESHGFTKMHENLNYSGERLLKVFPGRNGMDTIEKANAVAAGGPEKIAEAIYGGDWGKRRGGPGNTEASDGWKFHGRGFVQLTGRYNYEHYGKALGLDLANHPDLAAEPANAAKIATQYWKERVVALGHQHDVTHATKDVNGRYTALAERKAAATQWETKLAQGYKPGDPESGKTMQDVGEIQTKLGQLGYTNPDKTPLATDGHMGRNTREALKAFQHEHHLKETGTADSTTLKAIDATLKERGVQRQAAPTIEQSNDPKRGGPSQITDPAHPGNTLFKQAQAGMQAIDAKYGRPSDHQTDNAAGHVAVKAQCAGMKCIDHLELGGTSGDKIIAVQGKLGSGLSKVISVDTVEALNTPLAQSSQASAEVHAQQQSQRSQQVNQPVQTQEAPAMSR